MMEHGIHGRSVLSSDLVAEEGVIRKPRVLVVNDTQEILELFRDLLEEEGFEVFLYAYAFRDLDDIKQIDPDVVILDFLIGGEAQGWQLLQKMKMSRATADIPVIVCTAAVQMVKELEGHLTAKGVGLVLKPFDIDDLLSTVHEVMGRAGASAEPIL